MFINLNDPELEGKLWAEAQGYKRLLSEGEEAPAKILSIRDMGIRMGEHTSLFEIYVEVYPDELPPFNAATRHPIEDESRALFEAGLTIFVKFDPKLPKDVAVDHPLVE
jgi:hypothetical protein